MTEPARTVRVRRSRAPRKRTSGWGSVRKLPSGRYQASYFNEGRRYPADHTFTTITDARTWLAGKRTEIVREEWTSPDAGKTTFRQFAEEWIERRRSDPNKPLQPTTEAKYRTLLERHILPTFGDRPLSKIRPEHVEEWYRDLAGGRHPVTAAGAYRLLATIFNAAVRRRRVKVSPCQVEGASSEPSPERPLITVQELARAVDAVPEHYRPALLLAAWCQLRRGEVLALQRQDIDTSRRSVRIERAWLLTPAGRLTLGPPKTEAGRRTVYLPPHLLPVIEAHLADRVGPAPRAWLFPGTNDDEPLHPRSLGRAWTRARSAIGRPDLHFHDLRHSGLTWAAQTGATVAELMRQAGHRSPVAALRYQHAADERAKALADALSRMAT